MTVVSSVQVVSVPVSDQDRAKTFYHDVLGFEELADTSMGPDMRWVQLGPAGAQTSFTLVTWFPSMAPGSLKGVVLATRDIDAAVAELKGRGLELSPIESAPWGRYATFDDPDGNGFVLQASPSP
jgi:catechol 2,3-dioxygenase-like lactoylglutathione lyase family enzyme